MKMTSCFFLYQSQSNTYHQLFLQSRISLFFFFWGTAQQAVSSQVKLQKWRRKPLVYLRALCGLPHALMLAKWACTPILWIAGQAVIQGCGRMQDFPHTLLPRHFAIVSSRDRSCSCEHFCVLYRNSGVQKKNSVWIPHHHCSWWRRSDDRDHPTILDELLSLKSGLDGSMTSLA